MYKQTISPQEFIQLENKHGMYVFLSEDLCGLCKQYNEQILKFNIPDIINVYSNNENDFIKNGITSLPETRIYKNNIILFKKLGILYNKEEFSEFL